MRRHLASVGVTAVLAFGGGCQSFSEPPATYVTGLRVLAVKADPPQVAPGETTTLSLLAVDTAGGVIAASWNQCLVPPRAGEAVSVDCVNGTASLQPVGEGTTVTATMPQVSADALGGADATGGVYLPLVAQVTGGADALTTVYRLRLAQVGQPANSNPQIAAVLGRLGSDAPAPLEETAPLTVSAGDALSLSVALAPGSAETYVAANGSTTTELITTSWFATAGNLSVQKTSEMQPETVLHLDQRLPAAGATIDLWAVSRDERGGTDYAHRTLSFR
jgi:hypothetical protein